MKKLIRTSLSILIITLILVAIDTNIKIDNLQFLGLPLSFVFVSIFCVLVLIFYMGGVGVLDNIYILADTMVFAGYYIFYSIAGLYLKVNGGLLSCSFVLGMVISLIFGGIIEKKIKTEDKELGKKVYWFSSFATGISMLLFLTFFFLLR